MIAKLGAFLGRYDVIPPVAVYPRRVPKYGQSVAGWADETL